MNKQVNPDRCYEVEGVTYMLVPVPGTPEWHVYKDGRRHRTFTSLMAAKGFIEHVLDFPESDRRILVAGSGSADFKAKLAAALNGRIK